MNDINLLYVAIDAAAITLLVVLAIRLILITHNVQLMLLLAWMTLGMVCNVIASRHDYGLLIDFGYRLDLGQVHPFFNLLRNTVSGAFMLACLIIFRDGNRLPKVLLSLWVIQTCLEEPVSWIVGTGWNPVIETLLYEAVPAVLQIVFLVMALHWMVSNRDADLIQSRRTARLLVLVVFSAQAVLSLLLERVAFGFGWVPVAWQYPIHVWITGFGLPLNGIMLFAAFSPNAALVLGAKRAPVAVAQTAELTGRDAADASRIQTALSDERIYRKPGLSVHELAEHMAIPEYRLRNLVHEHLGFRNFNVLLHHYRVEDVRQALADPKQNKTPVLTLALNAGYQSINPFNRAFREAHGVTPTVYRHQVQRQID